MKKCFSIIMAICLAFGSFSTPALAKNAEDVATFAAGDTIWVEEEPNDTVEDAEFLEHGDMFIGELAGDDVDCYVFEILETSSITLVSAATTETTTFAVYDENGEYMVALDVGYQDGMYGDAIVADLEPGWYVAIVLNDAKTTTEYGLYLEIHTHVKTIAGEVVAPTCTEKGYTMYTCECGAAFAADYKEPIGHNYTSVVTAPTCSERGYTTYSCACGDNYVGDYVEATQKHVFETEDSTVCSLCGKDVAEIVVVPMYRVYNPYTLEHLFTADVAERDMLVSAGWLLDGTAWNSPEEGAPVYRLYNPYDDWHTYSKNKEEIDMLTGLGWKVDGVVCSSAAKDDGKPVYRLFNPYEQKNYHLLTASEAECETLIALGWKMDGIAWYCMAN